MKEADSQEAIERLEEQARRNPAGYHWRLAALALLGYGYVFLVCVGLLSLAALMLGLLFYLHLYVLIKFSFLLVISVLLIFKSMWVKFNPPTGIEIKRHDAPELYSLVDEVRKESGGPPIHGILIDNQFNCAIAQHPRLGILGLYKNYVMLGLPMLDSLSREEFKAVLAHEMGHLSAQHGMFGCWVYQVKVSWIQTYINLCSQGALGNAPIKKFAEWFVPYFDLQSLALMRLHELSADEIAAKVAGEHVAVMALINTSIKGAYLNAKFWPEMTKQVRMLPEPPSDVCMALRKSVREPMEPDEVLRYLETDWRKHEPMDSHPSLSERVAALEPDKGWSNLSDLSLLAHDIVNQPIVSQSAAESLLGDPVVDLRKQLSNDWRNEVFDIWRVQHQAIRKEIDEIAQLESLLDYNELTPDRAVQLAVLYVSSEKGAEGIESLRRLHAKFPDRGEIGFCLGVCLLGEKDEEGINLVEDAIKHNVMLGCEGNRVIASYFREKGKRDEAKAYATRSEEYATAAVALGELTIDDRFAEHAVSLDVLDALCEKLYADARIKKAYVVRKVVPDVLGQHQMNVLVLKLDAPLEVVTSAIYELAQAPECAKFSLIPWQQIKTNLGKACQSLPNAEIYDRNAFRRAPATAEKAKVIQKRVAGTQKSHFAWNRDHLVLSVIIAMFVGIVYSTSGNVKREEERHSASQHEKDIVDSQTQFNDVESYMSAVQKRIKRNWFPPKLDSPKRVVVIFNVTRSGQIRTVKIKQSSGNAAMDNAALQAVMSSSPLYRLPPDSPPAVDVEFTLDYHVIENGKGSN